MKRVAVVGCPGAGKTTFSRKLSQRVKLPIVHLDTYYHDKSQPYYEALDLEAWVAKATELTAKERWIMDGNFGATFEPRFARSDTVIFFDYPRYLCLWRIVKRVFKYRNKHRPEMPSDWEERFGYAFMRYVWKFKGKSRDRILNMLPKDDTLVIVFRRPRDAEKYLQSL